MESTIQDAQVWQGSHYCSLRMVNGEFTRGRHNVSKDFELSDDEALKILVALGDPVRFEIFRRVGEAPGLSSSELKFSKSASTTSHHTKLVVDAGVLETAKDGKHIRYYLHSGTLERFAEWAAAHAQLAALNDLAEYLSENPS